MKLSKILDTLEMEYEWLDHIDEDTDLFSICPIQNHDIQEEGSLYIGHLSQLPADCTRGTTYFCCQSDDVQVAKTGLRNVLVTKESVQTIFTSLYPLFQKYMELSNKISHLVMEHSIGMGLNHLLSVAYRLTGIIVHLTDNEYRLIAYNEGIGHIHPDYDYAIRTGKLPKERISLFESPELQNALYTFDDLYFMWGALDRHYYFTSLIYINGISVACFAAMTNAKEPFRQYDFIRFLYQMCVMELQRMQYLNWNENIMQKIFFRELIEHELDRRYVEKNLRKLQWPPADRYQLMVITGRSGQLRQDTLRTVSRYLGKTSAHFRSSAYGGRLVSIVGWPEQWRQEHLQDLRAFLDRSDLLCGTSESYHDLTDTPLAYEHAARSLEYLIQGSLPGNICDYPDCMYHILYDELAKSCNPAQFYHAGVVEIYARDQKRNTDWLETLEAYLDHIGSPDLAASQVNIHRNTLFYRIDRMQKLYNMNLKDGKERLHIMLTIRLLRAQPPAHR